MKYFRVVITDVTLDDIWTLLIDKFGDKVKQVEEMKRIRSYEAIEEGG